MRLVTSFLWLFVSLAFAFDAVAQPCELRVEITAQSESGEDMPCHDSAAHAESSEQGDEHHNQSETCCCIALIKTVVSVEPNDIKQPLPSRFVWASPLNDAAESIPFEYEPPPPRA